MNKPAEEVMERSIAILTANVWNLPGKQVFELVADCDRQELLDTLAMHNYIASTLLERLCQVSGQDPFETLQAIRATSA